MEYYECTREDSVAAWCATKVDPGGNVVTNSWEDCNVGTCPIEDGEDTCMTVAGPSINQPCVFPFTVGGETYNDCAQDRDNSGKLLFNPTIWIIHFCSYIHYLTLQEAGGFKSLP